MSNRAFHAVVVILWLSTMSWLLVKKVLPPLLVGDPPTYRSAMPEVDEIVCWRLEWNEAPMGWSASRTEEGAEGVKELHSRVMLKQLPLEDIAPTWLRAILRRQLGSIDLDARSRIEIDPLGQLSSIQTSVRLSEIAHAILLSGRVEDSKLKLRVQAGGLPYEMEQAIPPDALVAGEFSPYSTMPKLREGQTWTMPTFSPFRPNSPVEILEARVERVEVIAWNDRPVETWLVVFREDSGAGSASQNEPRGRMWVMLDGRVIQQEVMVLGSRLRFVLMSREQAQRYQDRLDSDWLAEMPSEMEAAALHDSASGGQETAVDSPDR